MSTDLRINEARLSERIAELARIGSIENGGVCRLALSDEDRQARDLVCDWMRALGMTLTVDQIGNVIAVRAGQGAGAPVTTGSHIDSVATGGRFDGTLGVLAGLEVIETLSEAGLTTKRPLAVGVFTNEEGARFAPDMMGSGVSQGALSLAEMLATVGIDGKRVDDELARIGYAGDTPVDRFRAHSYLELHVEQGPVLEQADIPIGAVTGVQGISWTEIDIAGTSNHAGTTPMTLRHDAGYVAAAISVFARQLAEEMGGTQVATVGMTELEPNLVNVIARRARLTVDLRNTDEDRLQRAEQGLNDCLARLQAEEGVTIEQRRLARFSPVQFNPAMIALVESTAHALGLPCRRLPSGAGHDAQMFAPNCPAGMIFVPSQGGISHNVAEYTAPDQLAAGANVLLQAMLTLADS